MSDGNSDDISIDDLRRCLYCGELLSLADTDPDAIERLLHSDELGSDLETGQRCHRVCLFRGISGSAAHIEGRCGCFVPGSSEGDDPGLTKLQAAEAALAAFRRVGRVSGPASAWTPCGSR